MPDQPTYVFVEIGCTECGQASELVALVHSEDEARAVWDRWWADADSHRPHPWRTRSTMEDDWPDNAISVDASYSGAIVCYLVDGTDG